MHLQIVRDRLFSEDEGNQAEGSLGILGGK
jgi:hypothetical protein